MISAVVFQNENPRFGISILVNFDKTDYQRFKLTYWALTAAARKIKERTLRNFMTSRI